MNQVTKLPRRRTWHLSQPERIVTRIESVTSDTTMIQRPAISRIFGGCH